MKELEKMYNEDIYVQVLLTVAKTDTKEEKRVD